MKPASRTWIISAAIVAAALWIYWPALRGDWVWDDRAEVSQNLLLRDPYGWFRIWFSPPTTDYFPLKTTVQWMAWRLFGLHVLGWHLLSWALHLFCAFWFWRVLARLGVRLAWFGGLLLAIHPLAVESVAWIAELKNTLSLALLLLAADRYLAASETEEEGRPPPFQRNYWGAVAWFAAALLAKSTVVMFPVAILLHGRWRDGRMTGAVVRRSAPFFALSLLLGLVTVRFQLHRAIGAEPLGMGGALERFAAAGFATLFYGIKVLLPVGLASPYARWHWLGHVRPLDNWPWVFWTATFAGLWWASSGRAGSDRVLGRTFSPPKWAPAVLLGLGWFLLNLLPVVGLVPMAYLRIAWVADHFAYIALLGPFGLAAAAAGQAMDALRRRPVGWTIGARLAGAGALLALAGLSRTRADIYRSDESYWRAAIRDTPDSWLGYSNLGLNLTDAGKPQEAIVLFEKGLRADPDQAELRNNYGKALGAMGKPVPALEQFAAALRLRPNFADVRVNFAGALAQAGRRREAVEQYREVLKLQPKNAEVHTRLGTLLADLGARAEAQTELETAIRLNPISAEPHYRLGSLRANAGELPPAIAEFRWAVALDPNYVDAWSNLGLALALGHDAAGATVALQRALDLRPNDAAAHAYLGFALASGGRNSEAVTEYQIAVRLTPDNPDVHYNLGLALQALGRAPEAQVQLEAAQRLQAKHSVP